MIFITAKFQVLPEHAENWPEISRAFTEATQAEPGCLWYEWSRSLADPCEYVLVEAFQDGDAGGAHVNSEHFRRAQQELPAYPAATPKIINTTIEGNDWVRNSENSPSRDDVPMAEQNVLGNDLEPCGTDPMTGFFRDGCCSTGPEDLGSHTICAVATTEFLEHQRSIGNDLSTPRPQYGFPGLTPGDRWCVTAVNWARAYDDGLAAPVVLAATNAAVLTIVPLDVLQKHAVDVPDDASSLEG